jgi:hypothetical protein
MFSDIAIFLAMLLPHVFQHSHFFGYVEKHCLTEKFLLLDRKILKGKNIAKKMAMLKNIA